ncbi:GNAT family N-acetyltransferase [Gloeothece verrucosa]|uniref:GCN5-related N-acetyltransferase n=1 Tax=Gloeothece verrucosa (strain PCC 7822) TaxID=497965 RepID=E0UK77_GLOV7|nr:GNAT family N-acetyltransferase [Gloeothece verrucosa]ADN15839.1 GCN5-related N-acetyltransferase [Gloeothece verrucosa PCC 7822]
MTIKFPLAQIDDLDRLILLEKEFYEFEHLDFNEDVCRTVLRDIINTESFGRVWLIESEQEAIGYAVVTFGYSVEYRGKFALIDELYLRSSHRGQGIGTQILQVVEETCRHLGIQSTHLEVDYNNDRAKQVYQRLGYEDKNRYFMSKWLMD